MICTNMSRDQVQWQCLAGQQIGALQVRPATGSTRTETKTGTAKAARQRRGAEGPPFAAQAAVGTNGDSPRHSPPPEPPAVDDAEDPADLRPRRRRRREPSGRVPGATAKASSHPGPREAAPEQGPRPRLLWGLVTCEECESCRWTYCPRWGQEGCRKGFQEPWACCQHLQTKHWLALDAAKTEARVAFAESSSQPQSGSYCGVQSWSSSASASLAGPWSHGPRT